MCDKYAFVYMYIYIYIYIVYVHYISSCFLFQDCIDDKQFVNAEWVFKCIKKKAIVPKGKIKPK